jgi:hypothetical protein
MNKSKLGLTLCFSIFATWAAALSPVVTTSPTTNAIPVFKGSSGSNYMVGNSPITVSNRNVGIGATLP